SGSESNRRRACRTSSAPEARRCASSSTGAAGSTSRRSDTPKFFETRAIEPRFAGSLGRARMTARRRVCTLELSGPPVHYWTQMRGRLALIGIALLLSAASLAQDKPKEKEKLPTYTESVGTEYVLVPVVVLDKKGRFVEGLE